MAIMTTGKFDEVGPLLRQYSELARIYEEALRRIIKLDHPRSAEIARKALGE